MEAGRSFWSGTVPQISVALAEILTSDVPLGFSNAYALLRPPRTGLAYPGSKPTIIVCTGSRARNIPNYGLPGLDQHRADVRQSGGYRAVRRCWTVTVCDETWASGRHTGRPQTQVSVKQKRHGEYDSVTVNIAGGFRPALYDLSIFIRSDVRHS